MDQLMPGLTGYQTLIKLREDFSQIELPIIIITALYDAENITIALQNGANDYVTKPVDPNVILARVQLQLDRRKLERELQLAKEKAEKTNQDKSIFISSMSHELKTPLNSILGFSQLLEMDFQGNQSVLDSVNQIVHSSHHLLNIINKLQILSQIESGKVETVIDHFSVTEMLDEIVGDCTELVTKNSNHLDVSYLANAGDMLSDKAGLTQILINLITNAANFTDHGVINISVDTFDNDQWLMFSIKDTGIGISEANQQKLFSDFFQIQKSQHLNPQGTGLGLSISLRLVQLLGGTLSVKSVLDEGAEFIVKLPRFAPELMGS
ncbi:MAG: HAMP domain-containing sensor histidine kinase [Methylococcales bacterium]|nr:HAMP domain-containing sensor histidine kinase [Methylococcales bacterium]